MGSDRLENKPITEENNVTTKDTSNIDSSNFMLEEYKTIASAFINTRQRENQMFRFYITLVTIPITLIAAIFSIEKITILKLPYIVAIFMIVISISGYLMTLIIIDIRFEGILYARTMNLTRKFFKSISKEIDLTEYLVLPTTASLPDFYESPFSKKAITVSATLLEVLLLGLLNSFYFSLGMKDSILTHFFNESQCLWGGVILWLCSFIFHFLSYRYLAVKKGKRFACDMKKRAKHHV